MYVLLLYGRIPTGGGNDGTPNSVICTISARKAVEEGEMRQDGEEDPAEERNELVCSLLLTWVSKPSEPCTLQASLYGKQEK